MKTKAIFSILFSLLMLNVKASDANNLFPELNIDVVEADYITMVESLAASLEYHYDYIIEVQPWMLDENAFEADEFFEIIPIEDWMFEVNVVLEPFTEVEEWMLDTNAFEATQEALIIPLDWMLDVHLFMNNTNFIEPMVELEPWMLSVDSFEEGFVDPMDECPLEPWMLDF